MGRCVAWFSIGVLMAVLMMAAPRHAREVEEPEKLISAGGRAAAQRR